MQKKQMSQRTKWILRILSVILAIAICIPIFAIIGGADEEIVRPTRAEADTAYRGWLTVPEEDTIAAAQIPQEGQSIEMKEEKVFDITLPEAGNYAIALTYHLPKAAVLDHTIVVSQLSAEGETVRSVRAEVYSLWQDETKDYAMDRYGNEVSPAQVTLAQDVVDYVRAYSHADGGAAVFQFPAGQQKISVLSNDSQIVIKQLRVVKLPQIPTYEAYQSQFSGSDYSGKPLIIEGEDYALKNDSSIRSKADNSAAVTPYHPYYKWMATVDGNSWKTIGQRTLWNFSVPEDGWYQLVFHYSQRYKEGQEARRTVEIDGKIPYDTLREVGFPYTGSRYAYKYADGKVYLTAGEHTLGMYVEMPQMQATIAQVERIMDDLQDVGLSLQQVAGSDADATRTWEIEKYIPGVTQRLTDIQQELEALYNYMEEQYGDEPASSQNLKLAADVLKQVLKEPEKLPTRTEDINVGSSSATSYLAELINGWKNQSLSMERIYLRESL